MYKRVFLVGFRATGKSTIGKILAEKLNWSFLDTDFLITQEAGQEADVLTQNGTNWKKFRELENQVLEEVSKMESVVISCGGGIGVNDVASKKGRTYGQLNNEILKSSTDSLIVLLKSDDKVIEERLKKQYRNKKIMPFLNVTAAKNIATQMAKNELIKKQVADSLATYQKRKPLYENLTDIKISTDGLTLDQAAEKIIKVLKL